MLAINTLSPYVCCMIYTSRPQHLSLHCPVQYSHVLQLLQIWKLVMGFCSLLYSDNWQPYKTTASLDNNAIPRVLKTKQDKSLKTILLMFAGGWQCSTGGKAAQQLLSRGPGGLETWREQRHLRLRLCRPLNRSSAAAPRLITLSQVRPVLHPPVCNRGNQLIKGKHPASVNAAHHLFMRVQ